MRPFDPHIPSFMNRLAGAILYPESNDAMRTRWGKHWLFRPRWQPGAIERDIEEHYKQQRIAQSLLRDLRLRRGIYKDLD